MGPTPADAIRQLRPFIELGVSQVTVYFHDRRSLDVFAREVVPAFAVGSTSGAQTPTA